MDPSSPSSPENPSDPLSATGSGSPELLASLIQRVAELERQVALLAMPGRGRAVEQLAAIASSSADSAPRVKARWPAPPPKPDEARAQLEPRRAAATLTPSPSQSLEDRLGSQIFNRIGIVALLFATSWALKLAIEKGFVGPVARILIGLGAGAGLILWSERFRRKGFAAFSYSLKAVATGVLYLSLWAAFHLYHLLPAWVALGAMILVTAWNAFMAWAQNSELLAAYALTGAFATPLLLSTGGDHEIFLFTYIAAIDLATLLLVRLKPWPRLIPATLLSTICFYIGWYTRFYPDARYRPPVQDQPFALTAGFILVFFALFAWASMRRFLVWPESAEDEAGSRAAAGSDQSDIILSIVVPLGNAAFGSLALYSLLEHTLHHDLLPWLMVALAAVYLGLMRLQRTAISAALHLALAIVFLTIAIPLKASGHTLTIAWLVEGLALLWASTRMARPAEAATENPLLSPASVLRLLSFGGYTLGFLALCASRFWFDGWLRPGFLNADLGAAAVGIGVFVGAAYLGLSAVLAAATPPARPFAWAAVAVSDFLAIDVIALLLTLREIFSPGSARTFAGAPHPAFASPDFFTALLGLAVLALSTYALARLGAIPLLHPLAPIASATFVLFNLATILTVEREISALWTSFAANLQRSLAISGFLMLYGAALLTLGFVKRSAFTRWQALILLLFTVAKVFLYDMSALSQGYRVASVLGLGVVLMAVSFAYQKDWLNLKGDGLPHVKDEGPLNLKDEGPPHLQGDRAGSAMEAGE